MKYSIGIVTFNRRFEKYLKPLINSIKHFRKDVEVVVLVNGINKSKFDEKYRKDILSFLSEKDNVFVQIFPEFRSLAKLWNCCLVASSNDIMLILNDDVSLSSKFFDDLDYLLNNFIETENETIVLNSSWSHFIANRKQINEIGWFDERLLGVGNEDGDMRWRYFQKYGKPILNARIGGLTNYSPFTNDIENQILSKKYSHFNHVFIREKYISDPSGLSDPIFFGGDKLIKKLNESNPYPYEKFFWDRRSEL